MPTSSQPLLWSGTQLKRIACLSMLLDHLAAAWLAPACGAAANAAALPPGSGAAGALYIILRCIGRLAFPIYCFLLAEGFVHTRSAARYAARMAGFAVLSEVPFDLAFFPHGGGMQHQNVYWTLALGVAAMACLRRAPARWAGWLGAAGCAACAQALRTDYGALGVALAAALYLTRQDRDRQLGCGMLLTLAQAPAPLAFFLTRCYNGTRGRCSRAGQLAYYWFYPLHLLALGAGRLLF